MNDYIDASTYTRAENATRLNYGDRFTRPSNWGQNMPSFLDNTGCQPDTLLP
jgi:hypothetical protein